MWPAYLYLMVVFYFASLGPVTWLYRHNHIPEGTYDFICHTAYFPVTWIDSNTDFFYEHPVGEAYILYVDCFGGH